MTAFLLNNMTILLHVGKIKQGDENSDIKIGLFILFCHY